MSNFLHAKPSFEHKYEERSFEHTLYPIEKPREEGFLKVSEKHSLFYATYGNPKGIPVVILHGGPGGGCHDSMTQFFDLKKWNVVMFDQRGAMRSKPFGCMEENTSQHSIEDIETLRKHLKIDKWMIFGGSWGSSLALLYGQAHSKQCLGFILRGIFLVREQDYTHLFYGMGKIFPKAYAPVYNHIPENERHDLIAAYYTRLFDPDPNIYLPAAKKFMEFDFICSTFYPNPNAVKKNVANDQLVVSVAKAYCHYAKNNFFLEPNQILNNMSKISHLPAILVHGRRDAICLPEMAYLLHQNWKNSQLYIIPDGGHSASEKSIASGLASASDTFYNVLIKSSEN